MPLIPGDADAVFEIQFKICITPSETQHDFEDKSSKHETHKIYFREILDVFSLNVDPKIQIIFSGHDLHYAEMRHFTKCPSLLFRCLSDGFMFYLISVMDF